ncbi:MAG: hypothetical protein J0I21_12875 [Alphaproteobacteria bacterium]|nr:hypothetical protein [Alphaproteobacteria bacterium]
MEAKRFEAIPDLTTLNLTGAAPPLLFGTAALAHRAYAGAGLAELLGAIRRPTPTEDAAAALALDAATAHRLNFRAEAADALQEQALASCPLYRIADTGRSARPLRVLALMAPGDLMANTPLDFITAELEVRLDVLFVRPGRPLPASLPDHDVAFFAAGDADPGLLVRLAALHAAWPRPALNDPACVPRLSREALAEALRHRPELLCPPIRRAARDEAAALPAGWAFPVLVRPVGSHAGHDLTKADDAAALTAALARIDADEVFLSQFIDYRGRGGLFRKYRVAFIAGAPFLCHMAVSEHWMVHYLNAGMAESRAKREAEAAAMATFDADFARRHADAFAVLAEWARLDYFQIDCAEAPDGRLLLFEADVAGIVHTMDPPDLFPYKPPQMRRVIAAFGAMLARHAAAPAPAMAG